MRRGKRIQYAVHKEDGLVISRVNDLVAWPVLEYEAIGNGGHGFLPGDYNGPVIYKLESFGVHTIGREWKVLKWTKRFRVG